MLKLWKWLYKLSERKIRDEHLSRYYNDIKCPNCKQWFSVSGKFYKHKQDIMADWGSSCECGNCGHISYWNQVALPFPALADEDGNILAVAHEERH